MNWKKRLLYMCGQLGVMLLARFFFQWIIIFCQSGDGIKELFSASAVSLLILVFRVLDGITDPVAGSISDSWVKKGKDRRTLVLSFLIFVPVGLVMCFSPTIEMQHFSRWLLLTFGILTFFIGYTFYAIPYWALIADYSNGDKEETRILSNLLGLGLLLATAVGFLATPLITDHYGYKDASIIIAIVGSLLMVCPYFAKPEYYETVIAKLIPSEQQNESIFATVKKTLAHKKFLVISTIFVGAQMSLTIMTAASPFIVIHLLNGTDKDVAFLMGPMLLTAFPSFFLSSYFSKKFGWQKTIYTSAILLMLIFASTSLLVGEVIIGTALETAMCLFALAGPMIAILLGLEGEAVAACAEENDSGTISTYFGVINLLIKSFNGLALFITGVLSDLGESFPLAYRAMILTAGAALLLGIALYAAYYKKQEANP